MYILFIYLSLYVIYIRETNFLFLWNIRYVGRCSDTLSRRDCEVSEIMSKQICLSFSSFTTYTTGNRICSQVPVSFFLYI